MKKSIKLGNQELSIETGKIAKQANGSVVVSYGENTLLVTATCSKKASENKSFFPLSVDYKEKFYASGRIPGGFFKREARPSEHEIIASRLTDRPIRPLFPSDFFNETQVLINVLSYDGTVNPDILGTIGASAALSISDIPWDGPVASVRVGRVEGEFVINPDFETLEKSDMEVIVSGTSDSILMVEGSADFISEDDFISCVQYAHEVIKEIINKIILPMVKEIGKDKIEYEKEEPVNEDLIKLIDSKIKGKISDLNKPQDKKSRYDNVDIFIASVLEDFSEDYPDDLSLIKNYINEQISQDLRNQTLDGKRADGRDSKTVRKIDIEASVLPRTHGSCLFTRGETQSIVVTTLGNKRDEQMIDDLNGLSYNNLMLHYNFPPFSVGEVRRMMGVSRREVGHGNLALRSIKPAMPDVEDFPYTVRIVSEITESNGSSSMATVCGSTLALMDAGVPIKTPIAGIAMGLIMENNKKYAILTDISGTEDHLGDMDFKVCGSRDGVTALQMDIKIGGLSMELMREALTQAKEGRAHILDKMEAAIKEPSKLSGLAPRIFKVKVKPEQIKDIIGPGGKMIKRITAETGVKVEVEDTGMIGLVAPSETAAQAAKTMIRICTSQPQVGEIYLGKVNKILDFGAFVELRPGLDGLCHVSHLAEERVESVEDVVTLGDDLLVKIVDIDKQGRIKLSRREAVGQKPTYS